MSLTVLGLGTAVPATRLSREESVQVARVLSSCEDERMEVLETLYHHTGIATRHMVLDRATFDGILARDEAAAGPFLPRGPDDRGPDTAMRMEIYERTVLPLVVAAARQALERADLPPAAVTHLVTASCTGFAAPGFDIGLMKELPLAPTVARTHVGFMGCHGSFNALRVARAFADADSAARVLVCAAEACSLHYHYTWNPKRMVGNALFADGAAAVAGTGEPGAAEEAGRWRLRASGSCLIPDSEEAMTWSIGNHGFDMTLSTKVPGLIAAHLRPWLETWLGGLGLELGDVAAWAIHPGGPRVLTAVEDGLGLPRGTAEASRQVLTEYGNMSSATILFILDRLRRQGARAPVVALGFGPGLVAEAMLLD